MARQNYGFQKRQKELAKQKKREQKRQKKLEKKGVVEGEPLEGTEESGEDKDGAADTNDDTAGTDNAATTE